jgi:hypothetical protein
MSTINGDMTIPEISPYIFFFLFLFNGNLMGSICGGSPVGIVHLIPIH